MRFFPLAAAASLLLPGVAAADPALDAIEVRFVELINQYRAENGLPCLSISPSMNAASDYMSQAMGEQGFFSHNEPPCTDTACTGRDPFERMRDFGHAFRTGGENIAAGYPTAEDVFEGWRNSPGHNENMLRASFKAMGIGRVEVPGSDFRIYWTNNFSDNPDGDHDCTKGLPAVGSGAPGSGGTGGSGGVAGHEDDVEHDDGGGCSTGGGFSLLAFAAAAAGMRRRQGR
ncbi:CAP domain-containing protein [Vulgatibacter sp.]|uniref:CAP domain-containing protein n=1 Tax=Vulgatibacter sp. TaxID=1971226 RepID=UPI003564DC3E